MEHLQINRWLRARFEALGVSLREYAERSKLSYALVAGVLSPETQREVTDTTLPGLLRGLGLPPDHPEAWDAWRDSRRALALTPTPDAAETAA